ncbi:MAG: long-chain N-acyl amino acid synthase [Betaproteobacteria bacterium]
MSATRSDRTPGRAKTTVKGRVAGASKPAGEGTFAPHTGETIFDDQSLRFRSLTLQPPELSTLGDAALIPRGFKIRVARRTGGRREAGILVERRYTGRGYTVPTAGTDPQLSTFLAYDDGQLVGTVGVRLDGDKGLSADELYRTEIDRLRLAGCRLCEFTRLAIDKAAASKPVLAGLFHTAYLYAAVIRGYTHAVIEVNPRHVLFYDKALNFQPIGPQRLNQRVNAPAVLLGLRFATIEEGLREYAGKTEKSAPARSLYPYGFPPDEEAGVLARLRKLVPA